MTSYRQTEIVLHADESWNASVPRGTWFTVTEGAVQLRAPAVWMGEQLVAGATELEEGASHYVETQGWVQLDSHGPARVCQYCERPALEALAHKAWELAGRWLERPELPPLQHGH